MQRAMASAWWGTVRFGEPMVEAVARIAKREIGIDVTRLSQVGYIEYPSHYLRGLDSPVGIVFEVRVFNGEVLVNSESSNVGWFKTVPKNMHKDQDRFLLQKGYLANDKKA